MSANANMLDHIEMKDASRLLAIASITQLTR